MRLVAENLAGERGGGPVFSAISFALGKGDSLTVTGPNGSGKSTLLRVIAGLLPVASGSVLLDGGGEDWPDMASACHYLGHQNGMKTALTVGENLAFWRGFSGVERLRTEAALQAVGLAGLASIPFGYLSAGQRRRAAIARLLVSHRPIWLLDEPTAGLDAASEGRLAELMRAHLGDGGIIVAATHQALGLEGRELRMGPL